MNRLVSGKRATWALVVAAALLAASAATATASTAPGSPPTWTATPMPPILLPPTYPGLPSATPMAHTPQALNVNGLVSPYYAVLTTKHCGSEMFTGGWFTQVADGATGATVSRDSFFAYNRDTGAIDPGVNLTFTGPGGGLTADNHTAINAIECGADGHSVFIGGKFSAVNGLPNTKGVVKYDLTTHSVVTTWDANATVAGVQALTTYNGDLVVCGAGSYNGQAYLASLSQTTGAKTAYINTVIGGTDPYYTSYVNKCSAIDISPTATPDATSGGIGTIKHMLVAGVFTLVNGVARTQMVMLGLTATHPVVVWWDSDQLKTHCYVKDANTVRAVKFNLTSTEFALFSTGGSPYKGLCDSVADFTMVVDGHKHNAKWVNYTGGDSYWGGDWPSNSYVCGAGHERWVNNQYGSQSWGTGGIPMPGISCFNASNGSVITINGFRWNATKTRNVGAQTVIRDGDSLWIMSDGKYLGCSNPGGGIDCTKDPSVNQSLVAGCLKSDNYPSCIGLQSMNVGGIARLKIG